MKVLISGSSGFIGSALTAFLQQKGHATKRLLRKEPESQNDLYWDPENGVLDKISLAGLDAVVHLAGENIAGSRWSPEKKARIRDSRLKGTRLLATALAGLTTPPQVLICGSAMGYYGDRGEEVLNEESPPGKGFLADLCQEWEAAAEPAVKKGIRVVHTRFGLVLSGSGGALGAMLTPFRLGAGGKIGSGNQFWSWIALDDVTGVIQYVLATESLRGPVNTSTPNPVTNSEFTRTLGKVLKRPTLFPMPAFAARAAFGEMADEMLLASTRMAPQSLIAAGYNFLYPELEGALHHALAR
jgi:hypothetical protein